MNSIPSVEVDSSDHVAKQSKQHVHIVGWVAVLA